MEVIFRHHEYPERMGSEWHPRRPQDHRSQLACQSNLLVNIASRKPNSKRPNHHRRFDNCIDLCIHILLCLHRKIIAVGPPGKKPGITVQENRSKAETRRRNHRRAMHGILHNLNFITLLKALLQRTHPKESCMGAVRSRRGWVLGHGTIVL